MWYMVYGTGLHVGTVCLLIQTTAAVYRLCVSFHFLMEWLGKTQLLTAEGPKRKVYFKKSPDFQQNLTRLTMESLVFAKLTGTEILKVSITFTLPPD